MKKKFVVDLLSLVISDFFLFLSELYPVISSRCLWREKNSSAFGVCSWKWHEFIGCGLGGLDRITQEAFMKAYAKCWSLVIGFLRTHFNTLNGAKIHVWTLWGLAGGDDCQAEDQNWTWLLDSVSFFAQSVCLWSYFASTQTTRNMISWFVLLHPQISFGYFFIVFRSIVCL